MDMPSRLKLTFFTRLQAAQRTGRLTTGRVGLGMSYICSVDVSSLILSRIPYSTVLAYRDVYIGVIGIPAEAFAGVRLQAARPSGLAAMAIAMPDWFGMLVILLVSLGLAAAWWYGRFALRSWGTYPGARLQR